MREKYDLDDLEAIERRMQREYDRRFKQQPSRRERLRRVVRETIQHRPRGWRPREV
jgi:hypothetical protein